MKKVTYTESDRAKAMVTDWAALRREIESRVESSMAALLSMCSSKRWAGAITTPTGVASDFRLASAKEGKYTIACVVDGSVSDFCALPMDSKMAAVTEVAAHLTSLFR